MVTPRGIEPLLPP